VGTVERDDEANETLPEIRQSTARIPGPINERKDKPTTQDVSVGLLLEILQNPVAIQKIKGEILLFDGEGALLEKSVK
jgi:hypothetical protein